MASLCFIVSQKLKSKLLGSSKNISNKYQQKGSWERGNSLVASHPKVAKDNANGSGNVH